MSTQVSLYYKGCDLILTLRVLGGGCGAAILTLGILCMFFGCDELRYYFAATYQIIFGVLMILGEIGFDKLLSNFPFLRYFTGKGIFYIFVALFSIGDGEPWEWAIFAILTLTSIFYFILGCGCCRTEAKYRGKAQEQSYRAKQAASSGFSGASELAPMTSATTVTTTKESQNLSRTQENLSVAPPIPPKSNAGDDDGFAGADEL